MPVDPFTGRREQLALLDAAAAAATAGEPRLVVVGGEAGIGKTRLIEQLAERMAADGAWVLRGACVELGTEGLPLAPVTAVLRTLVRRLGADDLAGLLPGGAELTALLPELGRPGPGPGTKARLFELFAALLRRLAEQRPVAFIIDDLQWADPSTRELLGLLARTLRDGRVLVLCAYRDDQLNRGDPLRPLLAELSRLAWVSRIELTRFSRSETADLVAALVDTPTTGPLVDEIHRRSGGIPLFVEELARSADPAAVPGSLRDLVLHPIERLPDAARRLVGVAAVGGSRVSHRLLSAVVALPETEMLAALRVTADARVLLPDAEGYAFRHELLREAVSGTLLPVDRIRLHRAYAETLAARDDLVPPDRRDAELAHHWYGAGEAGRALPAVLRAARAAGQLYAHAEQAQLLDRALRAWPAAEQTGAEVGDVDRGRLFEEAVRAAMWAGETLRALDLIDRGLTEVDQAAEPARAALLLAARGLALQGLLRDGALTAVEGALLLAPGAPTISRARVLDLVSAVYVIRGLAEPALVAAEEAATIATDQGEAGLAANAQTTQGWALTRLGRYDDGLVALRAAAELAERRGDALGLTRARLSLVETHHCLGQHCAAVDLARSTVGVADAAGVRRTLGVLVSWYLALSLTAIGRWDDADRVAAEALVDEPTEPGAIGLLALVADLALRRDKPAVAAERLDRARRMLGGPPGHAPWHLLVLRQEAELALRDNRVGDACATVAAGLSGADFSGAAPYAWPLLATGARAAALAALRARTLSVPDAGADLRAALPAVTARLSADTALWRAYAAQVEAELGTTDRTWPSVLVAWESVNQPYEAGWAGLRAAEAAVATGDRAAAARWLVPAGERADQLGAVILRREIGLLARAARVSLAAASAPTDADRDRLGLTEREWEVLRLVAAGRSNRQIGEQLYISGKTVSVHVSNILGKLGVASRGEASATVHRLRLFDGGV